jgi:hypothetical protein
MTSGCEWEPIQPFNSLRDYEEFLQSLNGQIETGVVRAVPVDPKLGWGSAWDEHWYECMASHEIWRLVAPDPPFRGVFKKV